MKPQYSAIIPSPLGPLGLLTADEKLISLDMLSDEVTLIAPTDAYCIQIANELEAYFTDPKHQFDLSYHLKGTPFQQTVWQCLLSIPSGQPVSYGTLAKELKTSPRAVGNACRKNPVPIIIPCHRVIGSTHLGGYAGQQQGKMMTIKKWLLAHEGFQHLAI